MKINIYTIEKNSPDAFSPLIENYKKMIQKFAKVEEIALFNKKISAAQNKDANSAMASYTEAFVPYLQGYNIALHPDGKQMDSFEFSKNFDKIATLNFFIGGAFGFEASFLKKCDQAISLTALTLSHKVAKVVLYEQVFRALSIVNHHPYHK